jgi:hypothetical protein
VTYELSLTDPSSLSSTNNKPPSNGSKAKVDPSSGRKSNSDGTQATASKKRPTLDEIFDQRRRKSSQALERTGFDMIVDRFEAVSGKQDFAIIAVQVVRSSDWSIPHWLMKWHLMATVLQETEPEHETSRTWFKTVAATKIRNLAHGTNIEKTNANQYPIYQAYGMVSISAGLDWDVVSKNLGSDIIRACQTPSVQSSYNALLKTHFPKVFAKMKEQQARASKDKAQKSFWDNLSDCTVKTTSHRSLDAGFLDQDIDEICNVLFEANTSEQPWSNDIRFACYRSGELPSEQ